MVDSNQAFLLGVNYWPRRKAMYWWSDFDAAEVDDEFSLIRDLNIDLVRLFLLWDDFQPTPDQVSTECMKNLERVFDLAEKHRLKLDITFFTGHMSGPNWSPRWLLDPNTPPPANRQIVSNNQVVNSGYRNPYSDLTALMAERLLLQTVVNTFKDHPALYLWNLGNEPDLFARPASDEIGQAWVRDMVGTIRAIDPNHLITCGLHIASLIDNPGLRVDQVFGETDIAVMHTYPMYLNWSRSPLDPDLVPFSCALTAALSGKRVLMEEFGGCTTEPGKNSEVWEWDGFSGSRKQFMASEEDMAEYISQVLPRLVDVGATGAVLWCFADYVPALWDRPPCDYARHERFFGLVRPDGSLKPHAQVVRDFAARKPQVRPTIPDYAKLNIQPDEYYRDPVGHAIRLYEEYLNKRMA